MNNMYVVEFHSEKWDSSAMVWCFKNIGNYWGPDSKWHYKEILRGAIFAEYSFSFKNKSDYVEFIIRFR